MSSNEATRFTRRCFLRTAAVTAGLVPVLQLDSRRTWAAEKVSVDDPTAKALNYVADADAAGVDRPAKAGTPGAEQYCHNCSLYEADAAEDEWGACSIFQGRLVKASGWCTAWVPQA